MKYKVHISDQAADDLRGIYRYIAFALQAPENADGQLSRLEKSIFSLNELPEQYRRYAAEPWYGRGLRIMPTDNYCIFYLPDSEKQTVTILRILYGGRDMESALRQMQESQ